MFNTIVIFVSYNKIVKEYHLLLLHSTINKNVRVVSPCTFFLLKKHLSRLYILFIWKYQNHFIFLITMHFIYHTYVSYLCFIHMCHEFSFINLICTCLAVIFISIRNHVKYCFSYVKLLKVFLFLILCEIRQLLEL